MCGIFVNDEEQYEIAMEVVLKLLPSGNICTRKSKEGAFAKRTNNGSIIKIIRPNGYVRGNKYSGAIISSDIDKEIVNTLVMPFLVDYRDFRTGFEKYLGIEDNLGDIKDRIFTVDIRPEDCDYAEYDIYSDLGVTLEEVQRITEQWNKLANELSDEKMEVKTIMINEHAMPYKVKQVGTDQWLIYRAEGIPKENIKYKTEFVNRSKETYLNINGEYKDEILDLDNKISIHLLINTDVYEGYEVVIRDGLVFVILHEIINEQPVLKDMTVKDK